MSETDAERSWLGPLLVLSGGVCIGFAPIGLRYGVGELGPQGVAFWRFLLATPMLFALLVLIEKRLPILPNRMVLLAGTLFALDIGLWHWALTLTSVSNATFIVNLGNICVGFGAWLFFKERPTLSWGVAVVIAVAGAAALSLGGSSLGFTDFRGDALALVAAFLVSGYMLASKVARRTLGAMDVIFWLTVTEAVVALLLVFAFREPVLPETLNGLSAPLFLAAVAHVGGQGLIIAGLGRTPAGIAGVVVIIQPVVAAALSWALFSETLTLVQAGGAALIIFGIFLAQRRGRPRPAVKPSYATAKPS